MCLEAASSSALFRNRLRDRFRREEARRKLARIVRLELGGCPASGSSGSGFTTSEVESSSVSNFVTAMISCCSGKTM